jgi:hypothetical protein
MWTAENRSRYDRRGLRYPSDMTDSEWALIAGMIPPAKRGGNARTVDLREVVNGLLYVQCREQAGRGASPTAAIIDSQSVKGAEKGGLRSTRMATMAARRSRARSATFWSTRLA